MPDFTLTPDQELIRGSAREFVEREVVPFARDWDLESYPELVRARIDKYGLRDELARRQPKKRPVSKSGMTALAIAGAVALLALGAALILLRR